MPLTKDYTHTQLTYLILIIKLTVLGKIWSCWLMCSYVLIFELSIDIVILWIMTTMQFIMLFSSCPFSIEKEYENPEI